MNGIASMQVTGQLQHTFANAVPFHSFQHKNQWESSPSPLVYWQKAVVIMASGKVSQRVKGQRSHTHSKVKAKAKRDRQSS